MQFCSVEHCKNIKRIKGPRPFGITFHSFPKDPVVKREWAKFCQQCPEFEPKEDHFVCSIHFKPEDYEQSSRYKKLKIGAIPTLNKYPGNETCIVMSCGNTKSENPDKNYYNFPEDPDILKRWCDVIFGPKTEVEIADDFVVCSDHFQGYCLQDIYCKVLSGKAIPSIKIEYRQPVKKERGEVDITNIERRIDQILLQNQKILQKTQPKTRTKKEPTLEYVSDGKDVKEQNIKQVLVEVTPEEMFKNLEVICRFCLLNETLAELTKISEVVWGGVTLIEVLTKYTNINYINSNTKMPQHVCHFCLKKMYDVYSFLTKCHSSENYLRNLIDNMASKNEEMKDETNHDELDTADINDTALDSDSSSTISEKRQLTAKVEDDKQSEIMKGTRLQQKSNLINQTMGLSWNVYKPKVLIRGPPYICPVCNASYKKREELTKHRKEVKHTYSLRYVCPFNCGKRYETLSKLREHYQSHTGEKWEKCDRCDFTTNSINSLRRHKKTHISERSHRCEPCGRGFIRLECYENHLRKHHNKEKLKCKVCLKEFSIKNKYNEHIRGHQDSDDDLPLSKRKSYMYRYKSGESSTYQCEICGKTLKTKLAFNMHVENHGPKKIPCDQCTKMFTSKMKLYYHKYYAHTTKQHVCEICGLTFKYMKQYKDHIFIHQEDIVCEICNKQFLSKRSLLDHMYLHNADAAPYKCHICQKPLRSTGHLNIHLRTHTGEKPFSCDVCGKEFSQKSNMLQHKNTHVKDRRYQCDRCGTSFKDERNCRRHKARNTCLPKLELDDTKLLIYD